MTMIPKNQENTDDAADHKTHLVLKNETLSSIEVCKKLITTGQIFPIV